MFRNIGYLKLMSKLDVCNASWEGDLKYCFHIKKFGIWGNIWQKFYDVRRGPIKPQK